MLTYAFWIALLSALLFGAATPLSKFLLNELSSFQLAGFLYLGAALGVVILVVREGKLVFPWQVDAKNLKLLSGAVVFGGILAPLALLAGLRVASASSVSIWLNLEMVATAVLGHFFFKDHLTRRSWIASAGVLTAALILVWGDSVAGIKAGLLVAFACFCWGLDNHFTALIDGITPAQSTFWKGLVAGSTNLIIGATLAPLNAPFMINIAALGVGVFSYGISIVLYITSAQQLGATRSQMIFSSSPFWGVLLAIMVLNERFSWQLGLGLVVLLVSIIFLMSDQHGHVHQHNKQVHTHRHTHLDLHHQHEHVQAARSIWHSHSHRHSALEHRHPHWPDLHHRHDHSRSDGA